jgi:hypothetical protein
VPKDRTWPGIRNALYAAFALPTDPAQEPVFADTAGTLHLAYHAWTGGIGYPAGNRSLFIDTLTFSAGRPVLR